MSRRHRLSTSSRDARFCASTNLASLAVTRTIDRRIQMIVAELVTPSDARFREARLGASLGLSATVFLCATRVRQDSSR